VIDSAFSTSFGSVMHLRYWPRCRVYSEHVSKSMILMPRAPLRISCAAGRWSRVIDNPFAELSQVVKFISIKPFAIRMEILNKDEATRRWHLVLKHFDDGKIFIYPTDTIYGIGCDATNERCVKKVRQIKERYTNPFSVIAPSVGWIREHCVITPAVEEWLGKLPGPYTLIMNLKKRNAIAPSVTSLPTIGVRIPDHWISKVATDLGKPIITTSTNQQGKDFMTSLENLDAKVSSQVHFIIYEGEIRGKPSTLVHLDAGTPLVRER
jgi:L-threonylcarbamoyladenylate synthase